MKINRHEHNVVYLFILGQHILSIFKNSRMVVLYNKSKLILDLHPLGAWPHPSREVHKADFEFLKCSQCLNIRHSQQANNGHWHFPITLVGVFLLLQIAKFQGIGAFLLQPLHRCIKKTTKNGINVQFIYVGGNESPRNQFTELEQRR